MSSSYRMLTEFTSDPDPETISVNPFWVISIVRFAQPMTFSRTKLFGGEKSISFDSNSESLIRERKMLVLSNSVLSMSVSQDKSSYVSNLQATLIGTETDFLYEIQPGDWMCAWVVNSEKKGRQLIQKIYDDKACNEFDDGLKFVGRVQSIRKNLTQSPDGHRSTRYSLSGSGFRELDSSTFYDPSLQREEVILGDTLARLGVDITQVIDANSAASGGISATKIIPLLLRILVGVGLPPAETTLGPLVLAVGAAVQTPSLDSDVDLGAPKPPAYAYVVPRSILVLLGQSNISQSIPTYADILDLVLGLQKYAGGSTPVSLFAPIGAASSTNHRILNDKLLGTFEALPVAFNNKSVWSVLEEFKNPAVNEMYTCLRVNVNGRVVPTLTVRQLPFSTPIAMEHNPQELTGFLELPRWYCDPILINSLDIGKSDAMRTNFVHVYGHASLNGGPDLTEQIVANPPINDQQDMKRNGLRPHMQTVACTLANAGPQGPNPYDEPRKWMNISADFLMGMQFTLTGSCNMIGIQAPICPGDNFEIDGGVYHIESVSHNCSIMADGHRQFSTSVSLSHGIKSDTAQAAAPSNDPERNTDFEIYLNSTINDKSKLNPGISVASIEDDS